MTEFSEVMKQTKRMCESYSDCTKCPLGDTNCACLLRKARVFYDAPMAWNIKELTNIERLVMDWAAANPEPRYPSYHEAWKQLFPHSEHSPCPLTFGGCCKPERCGTYFCEQCKNRPMHADIAEKLGVKPIGG